MKEREKKILTCLVLGITEEKLEKWENMLEKTKKATEGKKRILDPFVGYMEK